MTSGAKATLAGYMDRSERIASLIEHQILDTLEIEAHVERTRRGLGPTAEPKIILLVENLAREIRICGRVLQLRFEELSAECGPERKRPAPHVYWNTVPPDGEDCHSHLQALLAVYAHYMRSSSDAITALEFLSDMESAGLLKQVEKAVLRGLIFVEMYLEGLALHTDCSRLPDWPSCVE